MSKKIEMMKKRCFPLPRLIRTKVVSFIKTFSPSINNNNKKHQRIRKQTFYDTVAESYSTGFVDDSDSSVQ